MSLRYSKPKQLELAECKQSDERSSSESLEISYTKQSSQISIRSNNHIINIQDDNDNDEDEQSESVSSHYEEDEDSKMMELPEIPINSMNSIKLSLSDITPNKKIKYSPIENTKTSKYNKYNNKYKIVYSMHECTLNAIKYEKSQSIIGINWTYSHFWKRIGLSFSLMLLICSCIALILTFYDNIWKYSSIFVILIPFIIFCLIFFRIILKYNRYNQYNQYNEYNEYNESIEVSEYYKDIEIRNNLIDKMNKNKHFGFNINENMIYSLDTGYSGFAALNTILSSIYSNKLFISFPKKPINIKLNHLYQLIQSKIINDDNVNIMRFPKIKLNVKMINNDEMDLKMFKKLIQKTVPDVGDQHNKYIRTYYIAQFNKQPLFYCDNNVYGAFQRMKKWVVNHGYFSPIIGCYTDKENNDNIYCLLLDVDNNYGNYLVPISRMYQAIKYCDHTGKSGGLLKIESHFIL